MLKKKQRHYITLHTEYLRYFLNRIKERDKKPHNTPSVSLLLTVHQEWKTVSNILTLKGFALSYFCDSHISFLLLPCALSNFFCCGINMEFLCKFNYWGLWRFCKQRHIGCVSPSPSALKSEKPVEFLIYSSKMLLPLLIMQSGLKGPDQRSLTQPETRALFIEVCVFVF